MGLFSYSRPAYTSSSNKEKHMTKIAHDIIDHFTPLRAAVRFILEEPARHDWTYHGLGMVRCYPFGRKDWRVNVWNTSFKIVPRASELHTHPWNLFSYVIAGHLINQRFEERPLSPGSDDEFTQLHNFKMVGCGNNPTHVDGETGVVRLRQMPDEVYKPGAFYAQGADEIHMTIPTPGTVTLMKREHVAGLGDMAKIFWRVGDEWVDAAPRPATEVEVAAGCNTALQGWETGWPR
jgi:hypothetical protein